MPARLSALLWSDNAQPQLRQNTVRIYSKKADACFSIGLWYYLLLRLTAWINTCRPSQTQKKEKYKCQEKVSKNQNNYKNREQNGNFELRA